MNRSELVKAVAERAGSDEGVARRHVDAVFETVIERVSGGERVTVTGFGTFDRLARPARSARNPRTGAPVEVAAAEVPRFRSGQTFRNRVAGSAPETVEEQAVAAPADGVVVERPSPKKPKAAKDGKSAKDGKDGKGIQGSGKNGKNAKKAKKEADAKKTPRKSKAIKVDASSSAKNGKNGKDGKKRPGKAKARAKAGK